MLIRGLRLSSAVLLAPALVTSVVRPSVPDSSDPGHSRVQHTGVGVEPGHELGQRDDPDHRADLVLLGVEQRLREAGPAMLDPAALHDRQQWLFRLGEESVLLQRVRRWVDRECARGHGGSADFGG